MGKSAGGGQTVQQQLPLPAVGRQIPFATQQARSLFETGPSAVQPFDPSQTQALGLIEERALGGDPLQQQASQALQNLLNPDITAQLTAAVNQQTPQIQGLFARSGRTGSGLAQTAQTQAIADSAARLLGQSRQQSLQAALASPGFFQQGFAPLETLRGVGGIRQAQAERVAQEPQQRLQQFISQLRGLNLGGTTITSQQQPRADPFSTALGVGLPLLGAGLGAFFGGPAGASAGGQAGAAFSGGGAFNPSNFSLGGF